jgi:hypothetical protein
MKIINTFFKQRLLIFHFVGTLQKQQTHAEKNCSSFIFVAAHVINEGTTES